MSTGISAQDRSHTILTAIDPDAHADDLVTPGHVFPLRAKEGGVLVRAGHTEAGCDIARLAGKYPSSVICEILKHDGTMARLPDLVEFAEEHNLKIGAISDLIEYRSRHDKTVNLLSSVKVQSEFGGEWMLHTFVDTINGVEHAAMSKGTLDGDEPVLVRTHALNAPSDLLGLGPKSTDDLSASMMTIANEGRGVVCLFREPRKELMPPTTGNIVRNVGIGARMLKHLGLSQIVLLTDSTETQYPNLSAWGLEVVDKRRIHKDR